MFAFPGLLLAILAVALFGKGLVAPVVAMSIAYTPFVARLVRSLVIQAAARGPTSPPTACRASGRSHVAVRRLLPNVVPDRAGAVDAELRVRRCSTSRRCRSSGLGVQPPTPDWGAMINEARGAVLAGTPLSAVAPALAIVIVVVAFNIVGEELADRHRGAGPLMALLEISDLSLRLPGRAERPMLDGVSLRVDQGEMVGLVGESGSGKSRHRPAVLGLVPDGSQVDGLGARRGLRGPRRVQASGCSQLRRSEVSMIFQDPRAGINPMRRVGDFLTESLRLNHGWSKDRAHAPEPWSCCAPWGSTTPSATCASTRTSSPAACCSGS